MSTSPNAPAPRATRRAEPPSGRPSDAVCALATVGILFWLVGLALAIATNTTSGSSPLLRIVKARIFSPVLVPAWLDVGFDNRFTYGLPEDADHAIEVGPMPPDDLALEYPGSRLGERASRWRRLARTIALGGADGDGSPVAAGVGRGGFAIAGRDDVNVAVFRQPLPSRDDDAAPADAERVYAARVRRVAGDVQLIKDEPRGELAPLAPRRPSPTPAPEPTPAEAP
jgi:hypothetical protein